MKDYHINLFWSDEDDSYVADIPDLKCCSAIGANPIEALQRVMEARDAWLASAAKNNLSIPKPRYRPAIYSAG